MEPLPGNRYFLLSYNGYPSAIYHYAYNGDKRSLTGFVTGIPSTGGGAKCKMKNKK